MPVKLPFRPNQHGFHFANNFQNHFAGPFNISTGGLCGGMVLGAFNYFRFGAPVPPHIDSDVDFNVNFEILRTLPETTNLVDYIFHSQIATFENVSIFAFIGPADPPFEQEFNKIKARIDRGEYLILGLKMRHGIAGYGHQVLCYGYDEASRVAFVYDPNSPDEEVTVSAVRAGNDNVLVLRTETGRTNERYRAMFEQQELFADRISDRVTYDMPDNISRGLNFAVRPPIVNAQDGWRWCRKCQGMWVASNQTAGQCPAGGGHTDEGSALYSLLMNYRASSGQARWRWCQKCQGLFYGDPPTNGVCPAGGAHDGSASADYTMIFGAPGTRGWTQGDWRWCHKCQSMHYPRGGVCPSGDGHDPSRSAPYAMLWA